MGRSICNHVISMRHLVLAVLCAQAFLHDLSLQSATATRYSYTGNSLTALQTLYLQWSRSTPDLDINLAGWKNNPDQLYCPCYNESWGGVLCIDVLQPGYTDDYTVLVIGLTMNDASLVGTLPPAIGDLSDLVTLSLTGNPNLTGSLPLALGDLSSANILDLHDNGFTGPIPYNLSKLVSLQTLDFSGNRLTGMLPTSFSSLQWLRTLKLSHNKFTGNISYELFQNMPYLVSVDLSDNLLDGALPDLASAPSLHAMNVSGNQFSGIVIMSIFNSSSIMNFTKLDLSRNNFSGPLPDFSSWSGLIALDLSYNKFNTGSFSTWVAKLNQTALQFLGLQGMNLTGEVPLSTLNTLTSLKHLYLDYNNFNGTFNLNSILSNNTTPHISLFSLINNSITCVNHTGPVTNLGTTINLAGNPYCLNNSTLTTDLGKCLCKQICYDTPSDDKILAANASKWKIVLIVTSISISFCVVVVIISAIMFHRSRRYKNYLMLKLNQKFSEHELKPTLFVYHDLVKATQNFHSSMKLGEGAFGAVYKGYLQGKVEVAVKQLNMGVQQSALDDFLNEVFLLSAVKHKNLVKLKGCCLRETQRLLVYEFVENNDLAYLLLDGHGRQILTWPLRMRICLGVAKGLHYLHALVEPRIIHRDIKASNILLDKNLEPKIADFGLALLFPTDGNNTHIMMTTVAGTKGYLAPEYVFEGRLSEKVDIYSFGVVLLEVVSGRKNIDPDVSPDKTYLPRWARERYVEGTPLDIIDPTLHLDEDDQKEVLRVIQIAFVCVQETPEKRPSMAHVVAMLQGDMEVNIEEINRRRPLCTWNPLANGSNFGSVEEQRESDQHRLQEGPLSSSLELSSVAQAR